MNTLPYAGYRAKRAVSDSQYRHPFSTDKETETGKGSARAKVSGDTGTAAAAGTNVIRTTLAPDASRPRWESSRAAKDSAARSFHHVPSPVRAKCPCTSPAWCLEYLREQEAHCALCPWTHRLDCSSIPIPAHWLRHKATITAVAPAKGRGTGNYILSLLAPSPGLCCWLQGATG